MQAKACVELFRGGIVAGLGALSIGIGGIEGLERVADREVVVGRLKSGGELQAGAELRRQVTSPGGTTERALASFAEDDLACIVRRALTAARDRSVELAAQMSP